MDIHGNEPGYDKPVHRKVEKVVGCNTSVYVKPRNMPHYEGIKKLAAEEDKSFSEVLNDALRQVYFQKRTQVSVSGAAYLAIANGDLGCLSTVRRGDGGVELVIDEKLASPDTMDCPDRTYPGLTCGVAYRKGITYLEKAQEPDGMEPVPEEAQVPDSFVRRVEEEQAALYADMGGFDEEPML